LPEPATSAKTKGCTSVAKTIPPAFDLTADLGEQDHFSLVRQGSVRLLLKFSAALANTVTNVAYAEFENVIEVYRDRNVVLDFGV